MTKKEKNQLVKNLDRDVLIVLNPYTMQVAIYFLKEDVTILEFFDSYDDWVNVDHPSKKDEYISLHLDYDECASLSVYHKHEDVDSDYDDGICWQSDGLAKAQNIFIAHTEVEFEMIQKSFPSFEFSPKTRSLTIKNKI